MIKKLLVVALKPEWSHLKQNYHFVKNEQIECLYHLKEHPDVALLQVGVGLKNSKIKFVEFLDHQRCASVLHFGTSGALMPTMKAGDLFFATEIGYQHEGLAVDPQGIEPCLNFCKGQNIRCETGKLMSVDQPLINPEQKRLAYEQYQASAVDMESWSIAKLCKQNNISYLSCRGIFDLANEDLETFGGPFDKNGDINATRLTVNIIKDPKKILKIPKLQKRQGVVNQSLSKVLRWFVAS